MLKKTGFFSVNRGAGRRPLVGCRPENALKDPVGRNLSMIRQQISSYTFNLEACDNRFQISDVFTIGRFVQDALLIGLAAYAGIGMILQLLHPDMVSGTHFKIVPRLISLEARIVALSPVAPGFI